MTDLLLDLRYAVRTLLRRPGFTAVAVATLALGIGANTAIFSAVHRFLLSPPPFADPQGLMVVYETSSGGGKGPVAVPNYLDLQREARSFAGLEVFSPNFFNLAGGGERPERVEGVRVTPGFFPLLGVEMKLGRGLPESAGFGPSGTSAERVAVLGHGLWQRRFGADPDVLGSTLRVNEEPFTIVGVLGEDFRMPWSRQPDVWLPLAVWSDEFLVRGSHNNTLMLGRLAPGVTPAAADAEVKTVYAELEREYPGTNTDHTAGVEPLAEQLVEDVRPALLVLWAAVGFVLLIACANLANLTLARAAGRRREMAVRRALGADRLRLVRQLLTESALLGLLGSAVGLLLGAWGIEALRAAAAGTPEAEALGLHPPVLVFSVALGLLTGLAVGLVPALSASRTAAGGLAASLAEGGRGGERSGRRLRRLLVAAEIAMALVLLIGAGLMIASFRQLAGIDTGFTVEHRLVASVLLPEGTYADDARRRDLYDRLLERLAGRPEVASAAFASPLPLTNATSSASVDVEGRDNGPGKSPSFRYSTVSPGYFETMGIPLLAGRPLRAGDGPQAPKVMLIDELTAERLWPGESEHGEAAVGRRLRPNGYDDWYTIVGVVASVIHHGIDRPREPHVYYSLEQRTPDRGHLVVATVGAPESAAAALREELAALDPDLPLGEVESLAERRSDALESYWYPMLLLGAFAFLALALAALGIYGVMAYAVAQRTREIGLRMALGAARRQVLSLVLGDAARVTATGLVVGLAGGVALSRLMAGLLYGVAPGDPVTLAAVTALLAAVALAACWLPARRAARVEPTVALRWE